MASMMPSQDIFLERSGVENHLMIFQDMMRNDTIREGTSYTRETCDAMYFGGHDMVVISNCHFPLHFILYDPKNIDVDIKILLHRTKDDDGTFNSHGKNSVRSQCTKRLSLLVRQSNIWHIIPRGRFSEDDNYCKLNLSVSRPNSINLAVDSLERGGSTELQTQARKHLITNRLSRKDTFMFGCLNMYMWLQKCTMYYSTDESYGYDVVGKDVKVDITSLTPEVVLSIVEDCALGICVDDWTDEELMVLTIALEGHEGVSILHDGEVDIFSNITFGTSVFQLCARKSDDRQLRLTQSLMPPEIALTTIYGVVQKMGCILDWLSCPDLIKGVACYKKECDVICGYNDDDVIFTLDCPQDAHYGTLFDTVCNDSMYDTCEHTNLAASSVNLLLEFFNGFALVNNVHFCAESLALLNTKLFPKTRLGAGLYNSMMIERGCYDNADVNPLVMGMQTSRSGVFLGGNVAFFKHLMDSYVASYSPDVDPSSLWLQVNLIYGKVIGGNCTDVIDETVDINANGIGPLTSDMKSAIRTQTFLSMHGVSKRAVSSYGGSNLGITPLPSYSETNNPNIDLMKGKYYCKLVQFGMSSKFDSRTGYDSTINDDLFYSVRFFSPGGADGVLIGDANIVTEQVGVVTNLSKLTQAKTESRLYRESVVADNIEKHLTSDDNKDKGKFKGVDALAESDIPLRKTLDDRQGLIGQSGDAVKVAKLDSVLKNKVRKTSFGRVQAPSISQAMKQQLKNVKSTSKLILPSGLKKSHVDEEVDENVGSEPVSGGIDDASNSSIDGTNICGIELGDTLAFDEINNSGGGDCLYNAVLDACGSIKCGSGFADLASTIGWWPAGAYQHHDTAKAVGSILGIDVVMIPQDSTLAGKVDILRVDNPKGTIFIKFKNEHFTALTPNPNGSVKIPVREIHSGNKSLYDVQRNVASAYSKFMKRNGYTCNMEHGDGNGMIHVSVDDDDEIGTITGMNFDRDTSVIKSANNVGYVSVDGINRHRVVVSNNRFRGKNIIMYSELGTDINGAEQLYRDKIEKKSKTDRTERGNVDKKSIGDKVDKKGKGKGPPRNK